MLGVRNTLCLLYFVSRYLVLYAFHLQYFWLPSHSEHNGVRPPLFSSCDCEEEDGGNGLQKCGDNWQPLSVEPVSRRNFVLLGSSGVASCAWGYTDAVTSSDNADAAAVGDNAEVRERDFVPFSSVRQYKSIRLNNGIRVLLVSDRLARQASAALTIEGAGQFSDPDSLNGMAHLMEHMVLSYKVTQTKLSRKPKDFEEWINDYDGSSNGFTAYEKVCFHFNCPVEVFPDALEKFSGAFVQETVQRVCQKEDILRREVRRVNAELNNLDGFTRELYLVKSVINQEHPYSRMSMGSLQSLETVPRQEGIDMGQRLYGFFQKQYQPSKAVLVVIAPSSLASLESWVSPFTSTLSRRRDQETYQSRVFPEFLLKNNKLTTLCLFRKSGVGVGVRDDIEKLSFQWALDLDYDGLKDGTRNVATATQVGFVISQILGRRGPGSLLALLRARNWMPEGGQGVPRISFPVDVSGFQLLKLELSLTRQGFSSRSSVIAAVYDCINKLEGSTGIYSPFLLGRELVAEFASVAQLYGFLLSPRPPDAVELAFDAQFFGVDGPNGVNGGRWHRFPRPNDKGGIIALQQALQQTLKIMSDPPAAVIIATASAKSIAFAKENRLDNSFPDLSPASWDISPVTGARFYQDNMFRLAGKANEWLVARLMEDELSVPVINPLIPTTIRPPRTQDFLAPDRSDKKNLPAAEVKGELVLRQLSDDNEGRGVRLSGDAARTSIVKDYWAVLQVFSHDGNSPSLVVPRIAPEPSPRALFVLQLLSSRPARANVEMAARAELWKLSFENSVSDLAELGAPAGLAYEISFNKFGMRVSFLGLSQNIASYARRLCRRMVAHQSKLLDASYRIPESVVNVGVRSANQATQLSTLRRRQIIALTRESRPSEVALEGTAFFKSCSGGVCFTNGDILPKEASELLAELKTILRAVTGSNIYPSPAIPEVEDLLYRPIWQPRGASSCTIAGASLISDACGRVPR